MNLRWTAPLLALAMLACDAATPDGTPNENPTETLYPDEWAHAMPEDRGTATIQPTPVEVDGRIARRMSVDQLRRSIPVLFDGITWTVTVRGREQVGFDVLSRTLGEADYIQATSHNEEPSPLFAKFMDDMASDVCNKAIRADLEATVGEPRLVIHDEADVDATLRFLRLKLHGIYVPDGSTEGLEDLRALYDDVTAAQGTQVGWFSVCIAMLTAPELIAY